VTAFLLAASALVVVTLVLVTRPLWRPRPVVGFAVAASLALATALLYLVVGAPAALDPAQRTPPATMEAAIAQLRAELERDPDQPEGWRILARAYASEDRTTDALQAYAEAIRRAPDADVLTEAAEIRARGNPNRRFDDEAVSMLHRALELQRAHQRARWFLGIAQRQAGQHAEAARTWEPLLAAVDAKTAATLRPQIDAARADAGLPPLPAAAPAPETGLTIQVALAPALADRIPPDASVFVIARAPGTVMPVAVKRVPAAGFPLTVRLEDVDSPMPTRSLSELDRVEVLARVSASGDATARSGEVTSAPIVVRNEAGGELVVTIDRVVP
jgi:cytochrome c-type biogenesis protein CcmH